MNDPKTLQIIAEKACQFDRAHFDDDVPVADESLLSYHNQLPTNRKLITHLRPRYAVALGFFEGYAQAVNVESATKNNFRHAIGAKPEETVFEALGRMQGELGRKIEDLKNERDELQTKLAEAERTGAEHAAQLEDEIRTLVAERDRYKREATESKNQANIGIVIKPPPPPPAAPPPPNELRTEIDDELAQAAAEYANDEEGYLTTAKDIDEVHDAMKAGKGWYAIARAFVHGAQWQLSRIENAHAGDDPTMHFPPAFDRAPMPSDREIAELVCRAIYTWHKYTDDDIEHVVNVLNCEREDLRRKIGMFSGSTAEACAVKFALLHFRDRLVGPANEVQNAERTQYETTIRQKNERIAELEKELALSMETIAATAAQAAVWRDHTEPCDYASAEIARNALIRVRNSVDLLPYNLGGVPKPFVMDAIEEELANLKTQEAKHDDGQSVPKKREARIDHVLTTNPGISIAESVRVAQSFDLPNAKISSSLPLPIVFRDDAEIDYWEEMSCVLATKKDTTSQSIATGADEMVEERRKRLPSVATSNVVQRAMAVADLLRKQGMHVAAVNRIVDGKSRSAIAFGHEQTTLVFVDRPRHDRMQTEDVADEVVDSYELSRQHVVDLPAESDEIVGLTNRIVDLEDTIEWVQKRLAKMLGREDLPLVGESLDAIEIAIAPKEYDDELLLEAASFANASERFTSPNDRLPKSKELEHAKKAIREDHASTWYRVCRAYVNGALRSSRNP